MINQTEEQKRLDSLLGPLTENDNFELPCSWISGVYIFNPSKFNAEKRKELNSISQAEMNELFVIAVHNDRIEEIDFLCQKGNKIMPDVHCVRDIAFKKAAKNNLKTLEHLLENHINPNTPAIRLFLKEENFSNKQRVLDTVKYYDEKNSIDTKENLASVKKLKTNI